YDQTHTMIWPLLICSSLILIATLNGATVSGKVELEVSRDKQGPSKRDYSGVVLSLETVSDTVPRTVPRHAKMVQKGKTFIPHVLAVPVNSTVELPHADPILHNAC